MTQAVMDAIGALLEDMEAGAAPAEIAARYREASSIDLADPSVYWKVGRALKGEELVAAVRALVDAEASAGGAWEAHALMLKARHTGDDKGLDAKLRDLARASGAAAEWQAYRFIETDKWRNVQQVYVEQIGGDPMAARAEAGRRVAQLAGRVSADAAMQADLWRQVYQTHRDDQEAQEALIALYPQVEKWKEYAEVYQRYIAALPEEDVEGKVKGLRALIELYSSHLSSEQTLTELYAQLFALDPSDGEVAAVLKDKYSKLRKWPQLLDVLQARLELLSGDERLGVYFEMADLYLNQLRKVPEAQDIYEAILAEDGAHVGALEALTALFEKQREWDRWAEYSQRLAELKPTAPERSEAYQALATHAEKKLRMPALAVTLWERAAAEDSGALEPLRALAQLYEQDKSWDAFDEVIDRLVSHHALSDEERVTFLTRGASATQSQERALGLWRQLLSVDPENKKAQEQFKRALIAASDWDSLTEFFASQGNWAELVKTLESQAASQGTDAQRAELFFRAADAYVNHLAQPDRAIRALERVTQMSPRDLEAAARLAPLYAEAGQHAKHAGALEVLVDLEPDHEESVARISQLVSLYEEQLRKPDLAFAWATRLVERAPASSSAWATVARVAAELRPPLWSDAYRALVTAREAARVELDDQALCGLTLMIAGIAERELGDDQAALTAYLEALEVDPARPEALDAAERIYERLGEWEQVMGILDRKLELAAEDSAREALLLKQGALYQSKLNDTHTAIDVYQKALDLSPERLSTLRALRALYREEGDFDALYTATLRERALMKAEAEALPVELALAELELVELSRPVEAVERLSALLALHGDGAAQVVALLERALDNTECCVEAARVLRPLYERHARWAELARALEVLLTDLVDLSDREALLLEIGQTHITKTQDLTSAQRAFQRLLKEQPEHAPAAAELRRLAELTGEWGVFIEVMEEALLETSEVSLSVSRLLDLAGLYERLEEHERAVSAYQRVVALDATHAGALVELDRLYRAQEDWVSLLEVLRARADLSEGAAREGFLDQIGDVYERNLSATQEAIAARQELLQSNATHEPSLRALARLFEAEGLWQELAGTLATLAPIATGDERVGLTLQLAQLYEVTLESPEQAFERYEEVLALSAAHPEAVVALERVISDERFKGRAARLLAPIYVAAEDQTRQIVAFQAIAETAESPEEASEHLHKVAELYVALGGLSEAFDTYAYALAQRPDDSHASARLHELAEGLGDWSRLAQLYDHILEGLTDDALVRLRAKEAGALYVERIGDLGRGVELYERARDVAAEDAGVLDVLESLYDTAERWLDLTELCVSRAALAAEAGDALSRKAYLFKASDLLEGRLADLDRALDLNLEVLEVDALDLRAIHALERIYTAQARWVDLAETLARREAITEDPAEKRVIRLSLLGLYEGDALNDPEGALEHIAALLTLNPQDLEAEVAYERVYGALERWEEQVSALERQVGLTEGAARQAARYRLAATRQLRLALYAEAIAGYAEILAEDPAYAEALAALEAMVAADHEGAAAARLLTETLEQSGDVTRLVSAWHLQLQITAEREERSQLWARVARVHRDITLDAPAAFEAYAQALLAAPLAEGVYDDLYALTATLSAWDHLCAALEAAIAESPSDEATVSLRARAALVLEAHIGDLEGATAQLVALRALAPDHEEALTSLERLYQGAERWAELAEVLRARADLIHQELDGEIDESLVDALSDGSASEAEGAAEALAEGAEDQGFVPEGFDEDASVLAEPSSPRREQHTELLMKLAQVYDAFLEAPESAVDVYEEILRGHTAREGAIDGLRAMFAAGREQERVAALLRPTLEERGAWRELYQQAQSLLALRAPGEERLEALIALAELSLERLQETPTAIMWYGEAFKELPDLDEARAALHDLALSGGYASELLSIYADARLRTQDPDRLSALSQHMAELCVQHLQAWDLAEREYRYILEIDPYHLSALEGLDRVYTTLESWEPLEEILRREQDLADGEPLEALTWRLADLYEARLSRPQDAIAQFNALLSLSPERGDALARLEGLYAQVGDAASLFEIYARQVELSEGEERVAVLKRRAALAADALGLLSDSIELWREVLTRSEDDPEALGALEALYTQCEDWRELVKVYDRQVALSAGDVAREIAYYSRLGEVWGERLERTQVALEQWAKVLERDPQSVDARWATRALYARDGRLDEQLTINLELLTLLPDPLTTAGVSDEERARRFTVYSELGGLYEGRSELERSVDAWRSALAVIPGSAEPIERLLDLYERAGDWESYVWALSQKIEVTEALDEQIALYTHLAQTYEHRLAQPEVAVDAYQRILAARADELEAFIELDRLLRALERWDELVNLLMMRIEVTSSDDERLDLYGKTADLLEERGQSEHAVMVLMQAFAIRPDDERFGDRLERLGGVTGQWAALIQQYEASINQLGAQTPESVPLHMRVARWYDDALQQPQHAVTHYQFVQSIDPQDAAPYTALAGLYEKHSYWELAASMHEERLRRLFDLDERVEAWRRLAQIRSAHLEKLDGAISAYQEVLSINPDDLEALGALKQLYAVKQDFVKLVDVLLRETELSEDVGLRVENLLRVAEVREVRMSDVSGAIAAYHDAHELDATCVDALYALEVLYRQQQNWFELQRVYESLLIARTANADQLKTYSKLARLQLEQLRDRDGAIDSYRKMFYIDPNHPEAINTLDALYREDRRWDDLKIIYDQYLERVSGPAAQVNVRVALSELCALVYGDTPDAVQMAIDYLEPIIEHDPANADALRRLSALYVSSERWEESLEMARAELGLLTTREAQVARTYEIGHLYAEKLSDLTRAIEWYQRALELAPTYAPALSALKEAYEQKGMPHDVIRVLTIMEANTRDYKQKSACFYEMGRIYAERLYDQATGIDYYQQAVDLDPENVNAAPALIEYYLREQRWERAEPLLELVLERGGLSDPSVLKERHYQLAECALKLRKDQKAEEQLKLAYKIDSTHFPTLNALSDVYLRQERWEDASNTLQSILIHYNDKLDAAAKVDVLFKQGKAKFKTGDLRRALDVLSRVVEANPAHREALDLLISTYEAREKWEEAIFHRRRRLELFATPGERFEELMQIGALYEERVVNLPEAIKAYEQALELNETSKRVLGKLLPLYEQVSDWNSTVQLLMHFANSEEDAVTKAKYFFAIGSLEREQIQDTVRAVRSFDKALDCDPTLLKAFSAIEGILADERNFERQDRYYRKMLKRASENNMGVELVSKLANGLGEINRTRLGRFQEAIKAYNIGLRQNPDDLVTRDIVAELHEREQQWDLAVAQHREILKRDIRQLNSLHKLFRLYMTLGQYDEAWCVAQALVFLRNDRQDEKELFERHASRTLNELRRTIENEHWGLLMHPKKSALMDQLFQTLYPYNAKAMEQDHTRTFGVNKRKDLIPPKDQTPLNHVLDYVSRVTILPRLPTFAGPAGTTGLRAMNTSEPAILVGQNMMRSISMQEQAFSVAKLMFMMTPYHMMATLDVDYDARRNRLMVIIFTLMKMAGLEVEQFDPGLMDIYRRITDLHLARLNELLNEMQQDPRKHLDVSRWLEGLDHTASRVGFLVCNDLAFAAQAIRNEALPISRLSVADRIQELVLFSISDEYFALRRALGLSVDAQRR